MILSPFSMGETQPQVIIFLLQVMGFPGGAVVKNLPANAEDARDMDPIPGSGRPPGEGTGNPLQCSCLENLLNRGAWRDTLQGIAELDVTERAQKDAKNLGKIALIVFYLLI